jgi:hypothetical protein
MWMGTVLLSLLLLAIIGLILALFVFLKGLILVLQLWDRWMEKRILQQRARIALREHNLRSMLRK